MVGLFNSLGSAVSGRSEALERWISAEDGGGSAGGEGDGDGGFDALDNAPLSQIFKLSERSRKRKSGFQVPVVELSDDDDAVVVDSESGDELEEVEEDLSSDVVSFRVGDLVWAKIAPNVWWPGWICRKQRMKVLVSFFERKRSLYVCEPEIVGFEKEFEAMLKMARGRCLDAVDSALAELGRRLILGLTCPCQSVLREGQEDGQQPFGDQVVKSEEKVFEPLEMLQFVRSVAKSPGINGFEALSAVRYGAQANAFKCYISIERDWMYFQTMRLSDCGSDSDTLGAGFGTSIEKQYDHSSDDEIAQPMSQEAGILNSIQVDNHTIFLEQIEDDSSSCTAKEEEHLCEILTHLCCLALDPFYTGTSDPQSENSISVCRKILKFRYLVYERNLDYVPQKLSRYNGYKVKVATESEISRVNSVLDVDSIADASMVEEKVGFPSGGNDIHPEESHVLSKVLDGSKAVIDGSREDAKADCSLTYLKELPAVETVLEDSMTTDSNGKIQTKNTQKIFRPDSLLLPDETMAQISDKNDEKKYSSVESVSFPGDAAVEARCISSDAKNDDTHGFKFLAHIQEDRGTVPHHYANGPDGRRTDMKADFSLNHVLNASSEEIIEDVMHCDDNAGFHITTKSCSSSYSDDLSRSHPRNESSSVANIVNRSSGLEISSKDKPGGKGRPVQSAASNSYVDLQQDERQCSLKRLYACPLTSSSISSVCTSYQSSKANVHSECPTLLHMKFPKDFKLPSKGDLLKLFRPFGPVDHAKTRVFFYTGSAQVVFLHRLDAEAAYQYAKRKKLFYGRANVRVWIRPSESLEAGATKVPAPVSASSMASSASSVKSCLKTSYLEEKNSKRKLQHVRFTTNTQINSLPDTMRSSETSTRSASCEFDNVVVQDISARMLVLLEKCHKKMCTLREILGLRSYYSMFTHANPEWDTIYNK